MMVQKYLAEKLLATRGAKVKDHHKVHTRSRSKFSKNGPYLIFEAATTTVFSP